MRGSLATVPVLALAAACSLGAARAVADYDAPTPLWREGPVRYLLSKDEDDPFRGLATDQDRAAFIQRFWASRDPVASTPESEYRAIFYARVAEANRKFTDSTKPGWKTDRGKIFVLLGPPDDLQMEQDRGDLVPSSILWIYRSPAGERADPLPVIRFVLDATGEYRMSNNIDLPGYESSARMAFQIQALQIKSLPEQKKLLDSIVDARALLDAGPFRSHRDFFRSGDGQTFAVFTLGVKTGLLGSTPGGASPDLPSYDLAEPHGLRAGEGATALDPAGYLMFQGGLPVRPGTYTAYYGVVDHGSEQVYSFKESVEIPDLKAPGFSLSRITLASRLERLEGNRAVYATPFVLGNLRVLPRSDDVFRGGEELAFYYQIYGPDTDPIDGRPDLDVEYQFFAAHDDGAGGLKFDPLGRPIRLTRQRCQLQGYTLPLKDWPPGTFSFRVL